MLEIMTVPQAAECLGLNEKTVMFLIREKILPCTRTRGGGYLLDPDDVRRYDAERREKLRRLREKTEGG